MQSALEAELKLPAQTAAEAVRELVRHYASQIARGEVAALEGAGLLMGVVRSIEAVRGTFEWTAEVRPIDSALE